MGLKLFLKFAIFASICSCSVLAKSSRLLLPVNGTTNDPKIINGTETDWNGTRYQVSVRLKSREWFFGGGHICGGTLIAEDIVLTAGHCIWNYITETLREAEELSVVMGNLDRFNQENVLIFNITKISMLPTFVIDRYVDDIAILFLDGKVPKDYAFATPIAFNEVKDIQSDTVCKISGWGRTETGAQASVLMAVDVKIIDRVICKEIYGEFLIDGMLCAGYLKGERDACEGDSGGPLVCDEKVVGIISFGVGCAQEDFPGVYTDVANYIEWIRKEIGRNAAGALTPMSLFVILLLRLI